MDKRPKQTFLQRRHTDGQQTHEKILSITIRDVKIKITMTYHLTLVRMAIIRKSLNNKCCRGCEKKGTLLHCWWECKLIQPLWRTVRRFLKILGIKSPYDPPIPLLGLYPKEIKTEKVTCTPMFIAALLQ